MVDERRKLFDAYTRLADTLILRGKAEITFYCEGGGEVSFLAELPKLHGHLAVRDKNGELLIATDNPVEGFEKLWKHVEREKGCRVTATLIG